VLAVGAFATGVAACLVAVLAALASPSSTVSQAKAADATITYRSVSFGHGSIGVQNRPGGLICFTVRMGSSAVARSCAQRIADDQIEYASSRHAVGGLAGSRVHAVIVKLTRKGTVWATLRKGAFFAPVPAHHNVRAVVKVLADGSRKAFTVTGPR
jgi:hypothetical protein